MLKYIGHRFSGTNPPLATDRKSVALLNPVSSDTSSIRTVFLQLSYQHETFSHAVLGYPNGTSNFFSGVQSDEVKSLF
jgi:hypothetical protein